MKYESFGKVESRMVPGVEFTVYKMSFGRRMDLMRKVRELARRLEFLEAGQQPEDRMDAVLLQTEIDRLYLEWGLKAITGLEIDGAQATPDSLIHNGPEDLFREVLGAVKAQAGLTEEQRKNF